MIKRFVGSAVIVAFLVLGMGLLGIIPVRAYVDQRDRVRAADDRLTLLESENAKLAARAALLRTDAEVERIARRQFAMARPGEEVYAVPRLRDSDPFAGDELVPALPAPVTAPPRGFLARLWSAFTERMP